MTGVSELLQPFPWQWPHRIVQNRPDFLQPQDRSQPFLQLQEIKVNSFSGAGG